MVRIAIGNFQNQQLGNANLFAAPWAREGEIDAEQESPAGRFLFCCSSNLSTSVRPSQWKFFGYGHGQNWICNLRGNGESDAASDGRNPRVEDRRFRTLPHAPAAHRGLYDSVGIPGFPGG